jgi:hypothetical protein
MFNVRKKLIERAIHHTRRKVVFPDLHSIRSVGYVIQDELVAQEPVWQKAGIDALLTYFLFIDGKRVDDQRTNVIYRSDLNFWKLPPDRLVHDFINTPFDLLINMTGNTNEALTYICAASKANFKVGYTSLGNLFDLVVDLDESHKHRLTDEVIKTLVNLKRKQ